MNKNLTQRVDLAHWYLKRDNKNAYAVVIANAFNAANPKSQKELNTIIENDNTKALFTRVNGALLPSIE